jgi:hypothetical protein
VIGGFFGVSNKTVTKNNITKEKEKEKEKGKEKERN